MRLIYIALIIFLTTTLTSSCSLQKESTNRSVDTIIVGAQIITMDENYRVIESGCVAISGGVIVHIGTHCSGYHSKDTRNGAGQMLLPGFLNLHTHIAMSGFKLYPLPEDTNLETRIMPLEKVVITKNFLYWAALYGMNELLATGVTTFMDNYYGQAEIARAVESSGMRAVLGEAIRSNYVPPRLGVKDSFVLLDQLKRSVSSSSRIHPAVASLTLDRLSEEDKVKILAEVKKYQLPFFIHAGEMKEHYSPTQVEDLIKSQLLGKGSVVAHGTFFSKTDFKKLKEEGHSLAICPESNIRRAGRTVNFWDLYDSGVAYGFATDGALTGGSLSIMYQLKIARLVSQMQDPARGPIPSRDLLAHATFKAAEAAGLGESVGRIKIGMQADLILIDRKGSHLPGSGNPYDALLTYGHAPLITMTMVQGEVLYEDGKYRYPYARLQEELSKELFSLQ